LSEKATYYFVFIFLFHNSNMLVFFLINFVKICRRGLSESEIDFLKKVCIDLLVPSVTFTFLYLDVKCFCVFDNYSSDTCSASIYWNDVDASTRSCSVLRFCQIYADIDVFLKHRTKICNQEFFSQEVYQKVFLVRRSFIIIHLFLFVDQRFCLVSAQY
jgi:hypothetical protein